MDLNELSTVKLISCPRCGSKNVSLVGRRTGIGPRKGSCDDCDLTIIAYNTGYIGWMFNRQKEEIVEHCFTELQKPPFTSYVNKDTVDIWDGVIPLKHYISSKTGWKIDLKPAQVVGNGYIIDRFS